MIKSSQTTLARLLAKENITVVHGNFRTAFFDVEKRTLGLPLWKDRGKDVYDLLTGHEVGHALFTPPEGWHDSTSQIPGIPRSYVNVVEDVRIEKLVQRLCALRDREAAAHDQCEVRRRVLVLLVTLLAPPPQRRLCPRQAAYHAGARGGAGGGGAPVMRSLGELARPDRALPMRAELHRLRHRAEPCVACEEAHVGVHHEDVTDLVSALLPWTRP